MFSWTEVSAKTCHGRSQVRGRVVPELGDERMALEGRLHDAALNAAAASMNESNLGKARGSSLVDVLIDDRPDVPGMERVQVQFRPDGNSDRVRRQLVVMHEPNSQT